MAMNKDLRQMAIEMQDTTLLAKLSGRDLVAIEVTIVYEEPIGKCTECSA